MRFSIIIPVYNSECFLKKTLDSVCGQNHLDYEVICINDGSTDNSLTLLEEYQKVYPNLVIYTQKNAGPSAARNKGLEIAQGEYILFCDSDDWFERNTVLSELDSYIKQQNQVVDVVYFPGNTNWGGNIDPSPDFEQQIFKTGKELANEYCLRGSYLFWGAIYAYAYRLDVIRKQSISFNKEIIYGEDRLWVFDFLDKAKFSIVYAKPCYFYNVREGSLMSNTISNKKKCYDPIMVAELIWSRISNYQNYPNVKKQVALFYLASLRAAISAGYKPNIKYKYALIYTINSFTKCIKLLVLYLSQKLYKLLLI